MWVRQDFALRLGTSRPRLSTYMSGKVTPSAALMLRMHRVAAQAQATPQVRQAATPSHRQPSSAPKQRQHPAPGGFYWK
jgi:transcriptional regulator with XRE-family HTH domain